MMLKNIRPFFVLALAFLFYSINCSAQITNSGYTSQWKNIYQLVSKGLTKSALAEVNKIYTAAKKAGNDVQIIKSLLYQLNLNQNLQEEAGVKNIATVENEISVSKQPAKSILQSIAADMYWNYFRQTRWNIYNRTNTANFIKTDILTWTGDDFHKKISELYLASLKEEKLLQQTKPDQFDPILIKGNARYLRPALYDLLAHGALQYFKSAERDISRPSYAFEIKDEKSFATVSEFITHKFINKDSASLHYKALVVFQKLLAFRFTDSNPDALIDADINRIDFANQYGVMNSKDSLYIMALQNIYKTFETIPAAAQAGYLAAQKIFSLANETQLKTDSLSNYTITQAKDLVEKMIKKFPQSEGGINAKNLLIQILHKEINLTSEKVNVPDQPFRTLVNYKNISSIHLRIIAITPELKIFLEQNSNDAQFWQKITTQNFLKSWKQELPFANDYKSHSTEIRIDALPVGKYALLSSVSADFNLNKNPLALQYFHVSDISYINNGFEYFVLNRETGKPLAGARVQVWKQYYDYKLSKNTLQKQELISTDKNGYFKIPEKEKDEKGKILSENRNIRLEISYQKDRLFLDDYQNSYRYYRNEENDSENYDVNDAGDIKDYEEKKTRIFLFTDRSIYRPGQLVYFKGIGVTKDLKTHKSKLLISKDSLKVMLTDANGGKVDSMKVLLNEFGSMNGKFRLPENKLNGEFEITIEDFDNASTSFFVEEYKRPKFYAEFEKAKGAYRVNDKIKITGFAKAYAGNNIDGANVKYRVTRVARFLYPWMFWRWPMPQTQPLEITNGEIKTDNDGKFSIEFDAIPDLGIDKQTDPVFDYKVEADVTDINGETRSSSITVPVGYKALDLQLTLPQPDAINVDSLKHIFVSSKNLSGEFEPTKVEVKIYKLQTPQRLVRTRYWQQPDKFVMSKEEFLKYFPNDEYTDESKKESWAKGEQIFSKTDSTKPTGNWQLTTDNFTQGWYVAEATAKDKYGQEVKDVKYFQLYDMKEASLPAPAYFWNTTIKNTGEPGEKAAFISGTSANDVFVIQQTDKQSVNGQQSTGNFTFYTLNNEKKIFEFPITEQDRGGFGVYQLFVKDNRVYTTTYNVFVPWTNKQLDITYETFRDKILPGSEEKWKVKISGSKGDKVAAEMLASMYDASLDQFKPQSWRAPEIWPNHYSYNGWTSVQNFTSVQSMEKSLNEEYVQQKEKRYDALIFEGNLNNQTQIRIRGINSLNGSMSAREMEQSDLSNTMLITTSKRKNAPPETQALQFTPPKVVKDEDAVKPTDGEFQLKSLIDQSQIQIRKNFNETPFFFPELRTDKDGNIEFNFTMPEALTQWKLMTLAHTKDLAFGYAEKTVVTQKELMVQPNAPRFVREGDSLEFSAKIVNLSATEITGQAQLQLLNATTMNPVDGWFKNLIPQKSFTIAAGQSSPVKFNIVIPKNYNNALIYRIVAKTGGLEGASDGEEAAIPVLTNRMLVTETMPLPVRGIETKNFTFEKLLHSGSSNTLGNHALTVEFTTNPAWYAVQALPYLMEYPYDCAEQTFNRYYANSIAAQIVNASPKIKAVFEKWKITDTSALISNLQKNEELKSVLLEETPWVLEAQNESQQKKNIALLFDMVRMSAALESSLAKLKDMQAANGGFVWFKGGPDDRYMTQYILTGIGHLKKLGAITNDQDRKLNSIIIPAIQYLDKKIKGDYDNLMKYKKLNKFHQGGDLAGLSIQYLYMRSFFPENAIPKETQNAYNYYLDQSKTHWLTQGRYMQAMIALTLNRNNDKATPQAIIRSLKENSIDNEELGMYWKEWNTRGYWWYQAPIESQAMMIEAFSEISKDQKVISDLKTWLLKNKQTNSWHTTKATAEACYALLLQGTNWLNEERDVSIKLGKITVNSKDEKQEEGTGYFKRKIDGDKVTTDMGNISVTVSTAKEFPKASPTGGVLEEASWGAVYWQYFENLDKITFAETPLKLNKKLFIEKNTDRGPVLFPLSFGEGRGEVKVGDKIKVRIELRADRDMEYVHMKDMRAACMEPTNVISEYKYQGGLGYYESTKDASTNFFFNYVPKGTYVFEYSLFVTHNGNFSNGVTTIQCMYAPEFTAHSEGVRLHVK
ncbi:MAG: alpha-2-macroglobulin family protein [Ginsengibacter sp.]